MEADVETLTSERSNILYDFTIQSEWQSDPEVLFRPTREREKSQVTFVGRLASSASRSTWTFLRTVGLPVRSGTPCALPPSLVKLVGTQMNWAFDVTTDGHQVALLQDQHLEIRTWKDEFSSTFSRWTVARDLYPQWRVVTWSWDGDMVAYSDSTGTVNVYDIMGSAVCSFKSVKATAPNVPVDLSRAVCGLIFKQPQDKHNCDYELLVVNYQGLLKNYSISRTGENQLLHSFSFTSFYAHGISTVIYSPAHSLLYVGGGAETVSYRDTGPPNAMQLGITAWRLLSDTPHYKMVTDYEQDYKMALRRSKLMKKLRSLYEWRSEEHDGVYKLCLSPSGLIMAAIHQSGALTIHDVPSLRLRHVWLQEEQPNFNEVDLSIAENPKLRKAFKDQLTAFYLTDVNWWSDQEVILARGTGAVTVSCVETLQNLLGPSPEWFKGAPLLSMSNGGGFLGVECECKYSQPKRVRRDSEDYEDSDDDEDAALVTRTRKYVRQALYYVTDSERFQPPRKRPRLVTKTYRLVCLKSTTPEELYARKIEMEEYGEALALAKAYSLDCDLVYQRQWRKTPVSVASIQDYLSKISKRSWVLHECLERVPENIDAMRELLQYGLRGTDLEALLAIGNGEDGGRFILCDRGHIYDESIDVFNMEAVQALKDKEKQYVQDLLDQVDFSSLSLEQKELCRARRKLVQYLDRLSTYEEILGGAHYAADRYDHTFFVEFRSKNVVELATQYARDCDWQALDTIFTYHGTHTLPHRLAILSNFPETYPPKEYHTLLPEVDKTAGSEYVVSWTEDRWREQDWCELQRCTDVVDIDPPDLGAFLYEENPELKNFRGSPLNLAQCTMWYQYRAGEIERLSRQVDHALSLITMATDDKYIQGLDNLYDDLVTMDTLVYDCMVDDDLTFQDLLDMPNIDRLRLLMSRSSVEMYSKNIKRWLVPFLQRCDKRAPVSFLTLLREYLVTMARVDMTLCLLVFQACRADQPKPIISDLQEVISMALECIYACQSCDQLSNAYSILECLPQREFGVVTEQSTKLHNQVDQLECHLSAAEMLEKHELPQTIAYIRNTQQSEEEAKALFTKLTRVAGRRDPSLTERQWKELLTDVLNLREKVYTCVPPSVCYQIFVESLLCSGEMKNIRLAGEMLERSAAEGREPDYNLPDSDEELIIQKVVYATAIDLVLQAAREYFDSSAHLTDISMDLAKACLKLIEDRPPVIAEELDLIEALALLDGFGVNILPVQVRMSRDRLQLIQKAIDAKSYTYKNSQRLLKLGRLLRVDGGTDGSTDGHTDGQVLRLVAQMALKVSDHTVSYQTTQTLMEMGYPSVWTECKALAEMEEFHDIPAKMELLSYAVTHCTPDMIEPILRAKCLLEMQTLYERVHTRMTDRESQSPIENPFTTRGAIQQTKEIFSTTNKATRKVLSSVSDKTWWKKTLKSLKPMRPVRYVSQSDDLNEEMTQQGCHPFYQSEIDACYINRSEVDYERLCDSMPDLSGLHFSECLLYTSKLEETLSEGERYQPSVEVIHQLAHDALAVDATLGLAYLMALPNPLEAEKTLDKNPGSAISLQLAAYYYAIQIYGQLETSSPLFVKPTYHYAPMDLVQRMLSHAQWKETNRQTDVWSDELKALVKKLQYYNELLVDYNQAQVLKGLDRGIDIGRFTVDSDYKKETILGLAMTTEHEAYEISVSLAARYKLSLWDVCMTHLEYLFDSGLATEDIQRRISQLEILPTLQADNEGFCTRMARYVYPSIAGSDHDRLNLYYSLLEKCDTRSIVTPATHVKLLRKIKHAAPGLDYKSLTDGDQDPLEVLQPVLTAENITPLAKVAAKLPNQHGGYLHPSVVYCGWAIQTFWKSGKKPTSDKTDWIQRYESCAEYMQKLLPEDVIRFLDAITFVPSAQTELVTDCRRQIVRRVLKYSKQQVAKKGEQPGGSVGWSEVVQHMQQSLEHLDKLSNPTLLRLRDSPDPQLHLYADLFDLSRSQQLELEQLYIRMVVDGQSPELLQEVISAAGTTTWTTSTAYTRAVSLVTHAIRDPETCDAVLEARDVMSVLRMLSTQVGQHQRDGGELARSEDLMTLLRPFCADGSVAVDTRLEILTILEQCFSLQDEDLVLLTLYRTEAVVSTAWHNKPLSEDRIRSNEARTALYQELLAESSDIQQFRSLINLLQVWPPLDTSSSADGNQWCALVEKMVIQTGEMCSADVLRVLRKLLHDKTFPDQLLVRVHEVLLQRDLPLVAAKCLLLSEDATIHDLAITVLQQQSQIREEDSELLSLICQRLLVPNIVTTIFYPSLVTHILTNQETDGDTPYYLSVDTIANQLHEAGYDAEAGSLLATHRGLHPGLRTFDAALGLLSRWLSR